jgi:hypothetical protein
MATGQFDEGVGPRPSPRMTWGGELGVFIQ